MLVNLPTRMTNSRGTYNQILSLLTGIVIRNIIGLFNSIWYTFPSISVASNEFSNGIANGWVAPTLNSLKMHNADYPFTIEESSWIASLDLFGKILGAIFNSFVFNIVGRRILITSSAFAFFLMWVVMVFTRSVLILFLVRLTFGFFTGINDSTNSTYLAENSSPKVREVFGAVCVTIYYIGLLAEYAIAPYFSYTTTSIINAWVTFLPLLSVLWVTEPVQYLLMKGDIEQAEKNFAWLRGESIENENIRSEFERIKQNVQSENLKKSSFKKILTSRANYKSLLIVITLYALVGCTGFFPVMSFATMAFSTTDTLTSNEFTILFGFIQVLVVLPASFFVDRFKRRRIVLFSFSAIAICHAITAALYYVNSHVLQIPYFPWQIFSSITLYAGIYAAVFPVIFIIRGELFPLSIKATGGCLSVISLSLSSFFTTSIFLQVSKNFGIEVNFLIFSVFSVTIVVFRYFFLPETKNKTLIEIQEILEKNV